MAITTIKWIKDQVKIVDQTKLPHKLEYIHCRDVKRLWQAIRRLSVRGAPALGVAAAFGVLLGIKSFSGNDRKRFLKHVERVSGYIATSRPTAVNLFNALARMKQVIQRHPGVSVAQLKNILKKEALAIYEEDRKLCRKMGDFGAALIKNGASILTVCNAGALATAGHGTALGVLYSAKEQGKNFEVLADETRPFLQGARLTAWEMVQENIPLTLITDNMAGHLMAHGEVDAVIVGTDRVAANGDVANKIGTYMVAVLARRHNIPFYVACPLSTIDLNIAAGTEIPIEERAPEEVTGFRDCQWAAPGVTVRNPAFDVTPAELVTGLITERGVVLQPDKEKIAALFRLK